MDMQATEHSSFIEQQHCRQLKSPALDPFNMINIYTRLFVNNISKRYSMIIIMLMMCIVPGMAESVSPLYSITQWSKQQLTGTVVEDANADGYTWELFETEPDTYSLRYRYSKIHNANDYIYLHSIQLQAGMNYEALLYLHAGSEMYTEEFSVGIIPSSMSQNRTLLSSQQVDSKTSMPYQVRFTVEADDNYRLYIHATSPANRHMLYLDSLTLYECGEGHIPGNIENLTLTSDERTPHIVNVTCIAPTHNIDGTLLTRLDKLQIYRNDELIHTIVQPTPGEYIAYSDTVDTIDSYTYNIVTVNENGASSASQKDIVAGIAPFPYRHNFVDGIGYCTIDDHNRDGITWHHYTDRFGGCMRYLSSATNDADDWLFTPPLYLDGSIRYQVEYSCCAGLSSYPESMSVMIGFVPRPEEMSVVVKRLSDFTFINDTVIVVPFEAHVPGIYYMAFRANSKADSYAILLRSIAINEYDPNSVTTTITDNRVTGGRGYIEVATTHPTTVHIYNLLGVEVDTFTSHNTTQYNIASGIYLVQIGSEAHKIIVQ